MARNLAPMRLRARRDRGIVEAFVEVVAVMRRQDALEILAAKLAAVEQEHQIELEANEEQRDSIDARSEARALTAVLDFLQNCKVAPTESLLRLFRRYLRTPRDRAAHEQHPPRSRAS